MSTHTTPVSGIAGNVRFNAYDLPATWFKWGGQQTVLPLCTVSSTPFADSLFSRKALSLSFGGWWREEVNPFAINGDLKLGSTGICEFKIKDNVVAITNKAGVAAWDVTDEADGMCEYSCTLVAMWKFQDWSGSDE